MSSKAEYDINIFFKRGLLNMGTSTSLCINKVRSKEVHVFKSHFLSHSKFNQYPIVTKPLFLEIHWFQNKTFQLNASVQNLINIPSYIWDKIHLPYTSSKVYSQRCLGRNCFDSNLQLDKKNSIAGVFLWHLWNVSVQLLYRKSASSCVWLPTKLW